MHDHWRLAMILHLALHMSVGFGRRCPAYRGPKFGEHCSIRDSCTLSPDIQAPYMNCACDKQCRIYGDCCHDYQDEDHMALHDNTTKTQQNKAESSVRADYVDQSTMGRLKMTAPYASCAPISPIGGCVFVSAVMTCPLQFYDNLTRSRCENFKHNLPMSPSKISRDMFLFTPVSSRQTEILYINIYCALCNGESDVSFWNVEVRSKMEMNLSLVHDLTELDTDIHRMFPRYSLVISHPTYTFHPCKPHIKVCADDWNDTYVKDKCHRTHTSFVYHLANTYKNIFCAICNYIPTLQLKCKCSVCHFGQPSLPPFSILLDINTGKSMSQKVGHQQEEIVVTQKVIKFCHQGQVYDPFNDKCLDLFCSSVAQLKEGHCIAVKHDFENKLSENTSWNTQDSATMDTNICSKTLLKSEDYTITNDTHMYVLLWRSFIPKEQYIELDGNQALVCAPFSQTGNVTVYTNSTKFIEVIKFDSFQGYLSLIGNSMSIIGLGIQLIVYSLFPPLRNIPGKCLMCLSVSLLFGQLLFTLSIYWSSTYIVCFISSILTHFSFLAYFFWMNVMAFDIWHTFSGQIIHQEHRMSHIFRNYSIYALSLPMGVVVTSIALDLVAKTTIRPEYANTFCWINRRSGLIYLFALPVMSIMAVNLVFFALTVKSIRKVSNLSQMARHKRTCKNDTTRFLLNVKLAVIMGLTWLSGIIASLTDHTELWYVFTLMNSFQGVWICLAFVCTRKVLKMIHDEMSNFTGGLQSLSIRLSGRNSSSSTKHTILDKVASGKDPGSAKDEAV